MRGRCFYPAIWPNNTSFLSFSMLIVHMNNYASLVKGIIPEGQREAERQLCGAVDALKGNTKEYSDFSRAVSNGLRVRARAFLIGDASIRAVSFNAPELETLVEIDHPDDKRDLVLGLPLSQVKELTLDRDYFANHNGKKVYLKTDDFIALIKDNSISGEDITDAYVADLKVNSLAPLASISGATTKKGFLKVMGALDGRKEYASALTTIKEISPNAQSYEDFYKLGASLEEQMLASADEAVVSEGTYSTASDIASNGWVYNILDSLKTFGWGGVKQVAKTGLALGVAGLMVGGAFGAVFGGSSAAKTGTAHSDSYVSDVDDDAGLEDVVETRGAYDMTQKELNNTGVMAVQISEATHNYIYDVSDASVVIENRSVAPLQIINSNTGKIELELGRWHDAKTIGYANRWDDGGNLTLLMDEHYDYLSNENSTGYRYRYYGNKLSVYDLNSYEKIHNLSFLGDVYCWSIFTSDKLLWARSPWRASYGTNKSEIKDRTVLWNVTDLITYETQELMYLTGHPVAVNTDYLYTYTKNKTESHYVLYKISLANTDKKEVIANDLDKYNPRLVVARYKDKLAVNGHNNLKLIDLLTNEIQVLEKSQDNTSGFITMNSKLIWTHNYIVDIGENYTFHYDKSKSLFDSFLGRMRLSENKMYWSNGTGVWHANVSDVLAYLRAPEVEDSLSIPVDREDSNAWWLTVPIGAAAVFAIIKYGQYRRDKGKLNESARKDKAVFKKKEKSESQTNGDDKLEDLCADDWNEVDERDNEAEDWAEAEDWYEDREDEVEDWEEIKA